MNDLTEKTLHTERKYTGKIISVDVLDIELPDGRKAKREVIRHGNAVAILARRPDGKFVFVKQYRKAAEEALIEVIAGGLEAGEDPIEGTKRETAEETGYEVTSIKFLTTIICTPGYCEERIHIYFAELSEHLVNFYSLDAIIAVGYRVNSVRTPHVQFGKVCAISAARVKRPWTTMRPSTSTAGRAQRPRSPMTAMSEITHNRAEGNRQGEI